MHYVYLIESKRFPGKYYTGQTADLKQRLTDHNRGGSVHTADYRPWQIISYTAFQNKTTALNFEAYLKTGSGRAFAKKHPYPTEPKEQE